MLIDEIMEEFHLTNDDIRWFLSLQKAREIFALNDNPLQVVQYIHSKKLEVDLYDMEDRYLSELQNRYETKLIDEATIREELYRINREKINRQKNCLPTNFFKSKKESL